MKAATRDALPNRRPRSPVTNRARRSNRGASTTTAPRAAAKSKLADPLEVLTARAEARAYLWSQCEIPDLLDAVDGLQDAAVRNGLVDTLGQDIVQAIIADAFKPYREGAAC